LISTTKPAPRFLTTSAALEDCSPPFFKALKMNYSILGNPIPHPHAHLIPRYYGDSAPEEPIDPQAEFIELYTTVVRLTVEKLRTQLASQKPLFT
jgi:diadenosine tetraphosphate (Ap4A) HIT family hydrolase